MKNQPKVPGKRGAENTKYQQEDTASRDFEKQREAGAKATEAKAKQTAKSDKESPRQDG